MSDNIVDRLRELLAKATPRPWIYGRRNDEVCPASIGHEPREGQRYAVAMSPRYGLEQFKSDSALITEAINALPSLLDALDAALRDAERYRLVREAGCNVFGDYTDVPIPQNDGSYRMVASPNIRSMETLDQYIDSAISSERGG